MAGNQDARAGADTDVHAGHLRMSVSAGVGGI